jgi:predicted dehydrogenase
VHEIDVEDTAFVLARHAGGGTSSIQVAWSVAGGGAPVAEAHGTRGSLAFGRDGHPLMRHSNRTGRWSTPALAATDGWGFDGLFRAVLPALAGGAALPSATSADDGVHVLDVIEAAYRSAAAGAVEEVAR